MNWWSGRQLSHAALFWPALLAASAAEATRMAAQILADGGEQHGQPPSAEPLGATPSETVLDIKAVRLRDYGAGPGTVAGRATLICTPLALHGAAVADLAPGHSLVAALRGAGIGRLYLAEWRSATKDMAFLGIDDYLALLNVLIDRIGGEVDLIGLCQGGWLALVYAARFRAKVRKLVMAGAPVDLAAQPSDLSRLAEATPLSVFQGFVTAGEGRVLGHTVSAFWGSEWLGADDACRALQVCDPAATPDFAALAAAFEAWNAWTIDLPGIYYLEVIEKLYKHNELAEGRFTALGERIDLARLRTPIYCLAGETDQVVAPQQALAVRRLVATAPDQLRAAVVPGGHLSLFMGRQTLGEAWPAIVRWLGDDGAADTISAAAS